jgi:predicted nucleic acid-binding protein
VTLVDSSVWVSHFRRSNSTLEALLEEGLVLTHQLIIGELACGALRNRRETLAYLTALPTASAALHEDVLHLVERRALWGKGLGWIDAHLLTSAILSHCRLWTLDLALERAAATLKVL